MSTEAFEESVVEGIKRASDHLRGDLANELAGPRPDVSSDAEQLLKFHGIYAQDNRDTRRERAMAKETLDYIYMARVVIPGGALTSAQWLALDALADEVADGTLRLTTREAIQLHGVLKGGLRAMATKLDEHWLTTFGGCGDVVRNVVLCPSLHHGEDDEQLGAVATRLARRFRARTQAHWEIFVNGDKAATRETDEQPFYGETYLPRKFKIAIASPHENCVDVFAQDVGLIPGTHPEAGRGFTMVVGGGLGRSYANPDTFARLGDPLAFVTDDEVDETIAAVVDTYRELGNRVERKRARLKYVLADLGLDRFVAEMESRLGRALRAPLPIGPFGLDDHLGWRELANGTWHVGVRVGAGRVADRGDVRLRSALRALATRGDLTFHLTPLQDLIVSGVARADRDDVAVLLRTHGVRVDDELGPIERTALACPALPTCSQALTESERRLPDLVGALEGALAQSSARRRPLQLRLTGCPNGCARPAVAEIGVVGRTKSTYDVVLGGSGRGDRLARTFREKVTLDEIPDLVAPLFERWGVEGTPGESFGDFVTRTGIA
ncbi:MAG: NADPH-dependent assimilatory sulfite reductase hemoprotein subunit [Acidobacteriota bacterium]|nr:NADPH-dependent assimilatory sulfite reductase hemoprotein subunit [Acidobacteriota bacterium]